MKKIYIIGNGGSGKTTLALFLKNQLDLPHLELDDIYWNNNQKKAYNIKRGEEERDALLNHFLQENKNAFVIDGVYEKEWIDPILKEVDKVIILMPNFLLSEWRCLKRDILKVFQKEKSGGFLSLYRLLKWNIKYRYKKLPLFIQKLDKEQINYQIIKSNNLKHIKQELNLC